MSIIGSELLLASAAATGYQVERSLRFNSSDSAYLSRAVSTAGDRKKWTLSLWVKRSGLGQDSRIFSAATSGSNQAGITFNTDNTIEIFDYQGSYGYRKVTTQVFRDASAWYHLLLAADFDNATAEDRLQFYVNGSRVTSFSTNTNPSSGYSTGLINSAVQHGIGAYTGPAALLNGYVADVIFIDGQQLTPSSFTEVSATTGQLIPKAYTGTFTGNSFWLKFADNSAATATTLGKDSSGLGNNWTPNNLSVTAGAGNDCLVDTPTSYGTDTGAGGEVRGNYCTLNPLINASYNTYSNGNLECAFPGATTGATAVSTLAVSSGKWYWELNRNDVSAGLLAGIARIDTNTLNLIGSNATSYAYKDSNGNKINNGTSTAYGATWNNTNIIGVALDLDAGTLVFYKDGVSQGTAFSGLSGTFYPAFSEDNAGSGSGVATNFGQRPFAFPVSGFKALCDTNLPAPVVAKPSTVMDVKLYTGTGSTQTISGLGFSPDFVWLKARSAATAHLLFDQIRGATYYLSSNATDAESNSPSNTLTAFTSDGFTLGSNSSANGSSVTLAAWTWDAGTSTVTNTQGSITSQVRANASAGFSIVTYTGNGTSGGTIGHGLGAAPRIYIVKRRDSATNWVVFTTLIDGSVDYLFLNDSAAKGDLGIAAPTSTVASLTSGGDNNANGGTYVAYCFAPVAGYSSFGSYTGNGSADGPFVFCGFRPRYLLIKQTTSAGDSWVIADTVRDAYNVSEKWLLADQSIAEVTGSLRYIDFLSNGFKIRGTGSGTNASANTYIYFAVAENPFAYARAR